MEINVHIHLPKPLVALLETLVAPQVPTSEPAVDSRTVADAPEAPAKRTRKKAEPVEEVAAEPEASPASPPVAEPESAKDEKPTGVTAAMLKEKVVHISAKLKKADRVKEVAEHFGVEKLSLLDPKHFEECYQKLLQIEAE